MQEITFYPGIDLKIAYKNLLIASEQLGCTTFVTFNGATIYSTDTLTEVYKKVTGMTPRAFKKAVDDHANEMDEIENNYKKQILQLITLYRENARGVVADDKLEAWDKMVPVCLNDLYKTLLLDCWLELIPIIDRDVPANEKYTIAKKVLDNQNHSGWSQCMLFGGLKEFSAYGDEFDQWNRYNELSETIQINI